jgi:hypothetical protein
MLYYGYSNPTQRLYAVSQVGAATEYSGTKPTSELYDLPPEAQITAAPTQIGTDISGGGSSATFLGNVVLHDSKVISYFSGYDGADYGGVYAWDGATQTREAYTDTNLTSKGLSSGWRVVYTHRPLFIYGGNVWLLATQQGSNPTYKFWKRDTGTSAWTNEFTVTDTTFRTVYGGGPGVSDVDPVVLGGVAYVLRVLEGTGSTNYCIEIYSFDPAAGVGSELTLVHQLGDPASKTNTYYQCNGLTVFNSWMYFVHRYNAGNWYLGRANAGTMQALHHDMGALGAAGAARPVVVGSDLYTVWGNSYRKSAGTDTTSWSAVTATAVGFNQDLVVATFA